MKYRQPTIGWRYSHRFYLLLVFIPFLFSACGFRNEDQFPLVKLVNPLIGTAPLLDTGIIGYTPPDKWRVWAGLVFPGTSLPNALVQLSPITEFGSGAGYEYEDTEIYGFAHTNKGHWNLCHIPVLPVSGPLQGQHFKSGFSHGSETAMPGYYQVFLQDYNVNVELTSTLRCGYHRYSFGTGDERKLAFYLSKSNERVQHWELSQVGQKAISGYQMTGAKVYFYAEFNEVITEVEQLLNTSSEYDVLYFKEGESKSIEMKIGLSFVSVENARENLEKEIADQTFDEVKMKAWQIWEGHLGRVQVKGGTAKQREMFYTSLYRAFLWPALRSDVNGEYLDADRNVVKADFNYYTIPSFWDTYRNKLVLLAMLSPDVTTDVIKTLIDIGEKKGFIPTFFHGDHAAVFIAGSYLRGIDNFDVEKAYELLVRNATIEGGTRPHINEYMDKGYISTPSVKNPHVETKAKAGVTKTLEYAYDDYAIALLADKLGDAENYQIFMDRSQNYRNVFDSKSGFMRGRLEDGSWVSNFNPQYPYYEYMYREANAWQSTFFAPHDVKGLIDLYGGEKNFESKLDSLFTIPWNSSYIARNVSGFIGQYCHGNQPDHNFPHLYSFIGKQEKSQQVLDSIMNCYYGIGEEGLALCGMDDAGEMSSWYVFSAMGMYPFSPADTDYLVTVPLFDEVIFMTSKGTSLRILKQNDGKKINQVTLNGKDVQGYKISHGQIMAGGDLVLH
jgi:predicted alpha-1,2-mannosidase